MFEPTLQIFDVDLGLARVGLRFDEFGDDFGDGLLRQVNRMPLEPEVHALFECHAVRKALGGGDIIGHDEVEVRVRAPVAELLLGVDVGSAISAGELQDLRLTVGELGDDEAGFGAGTFDVSELLFDAPVAGVVNERELRVLGLQNLLLRVGIKTVNPIPRGVDGDGNAPFFDGFRLESALLLLRFTE